MGRARQVIRKGITKKSPAGIQQKKQLIWNNPLNELLQKEIEKINDELASRQHAIKHYTDYLLKLNVSETNDENNYNWIETTQVLDASVKRLYELIAIKHTLCRMQKNDGHTKN